MYPISMKKLLTFILLFTPIFMNAQTKTIGEIIRLDPDLDFLIEKDAKIEVLADGFKWSEGPAWVKNGGYLIFSDVPQNTVFRWKEGEGITEFLKPSGYTGRGTYSREPGSNGLIISLDGKLISCEHGDRRVTIMPLEGGGKRTLTDNHAGKRYNSPNDVVQKLNGDIYFTDPPYGLPKHENDPSRETDVFGVYRVAKNGQTTLVISDLTRPNGLAFSPDESILYVNQSDPTRAYIMAYPVLKNGLLGKGKIFYDTTPMVKEGLKGLPDGLKLDNKGNLFATGPGGVLVISHKGKLLGRIETTQPTANCGWGDDGSVLYITANNMLMRIKTKAKGVGF
jgi:gluconolactonase